MVRSPRTIAKVSRGWLVDQVNEAAASSEPISSEKPEGEPDAAMLLTELRDVGFSSVDETNVQELLNVGSNEPGYTALTEEEIVQAVGRLEE